MAYRAEIEIVAKGITKVAELQKNLNQLSTQIDHLNGPGSLKDFNGQLARSIKLLDRVQQGTVEEKRAVEQYVTALKNANSAQLRTNSLIAEEITRRDGATASLKRYNAAAASARQPGGSMAGRYMRPGTGVSTTQYSSPIGPDPSFVFSGQSTDVGGRLRAIKAAKDAMIAAEAEVNRVTRAFEQQETTRELANDKLAFDKKMSLLEAEHQKTLKLNKKENDAALKNFDRRLNAQTAKKEKSSKRLESLALGAGFPLLFGGGPGQVLGGIAGSFVGSGFGGQIIGSAIGGQIETFASSIAELGNALSKTNPNVDLLIEAIGGVNNEIGERIKLLEELEGKEAARLAAEKELTDLIGGNGVSALKEFGEDTLELSNELSRFFTLVQAGMAELINSAGIFKAISGELERGVLLEQARRNQTDPELALLKAQSQNMQRFFNPDALKEDEEMMNRMIARVREINAANRTGQDEQLVALRAKQEAKERQRELDKLAKQDLDEKIQKHKIAQGAIQAQTVALEGQIQIFNLQAQAAQSVFAVTQARNKSELSALKLEESRLQRQLANLQRVDGFYNKQRDIINKIANNRKKQAEIEFKVAQQSIKQMVAKAELERQAVRFQVQKINLQIELLRLQAEEIEDTQKKLESLARINQQAKVSAEIAKQMTITADKSLASAKEIAKYQLQSAKHLRDGKLESIEAERVDARRAVHSAAIARNAKAAASATSSGSSSVGSVSDAVNKATTLGPAGRTTQTMSTAGRIDSDVYNKVIENAPFRGYKNPADLVNALDKAQASKDLRAKQTAKKQGSQLAMIGEKGPEYVVPEKKAAAFATNYLMGARGAGAIPRYAEGGYTGSINIQTGPVMQQDNQTYLTIGQFEQGMRELTESLARGGRSYGSRQFQGVS